MALRINYNYQADFTHVNLLKTERNLNTALERLSTGYRINSAKDDAAGLFIADQLKLVANALDQGVRNAQDGISASQIAESSLSQIYDKLVTIYTKASQAASDTNDANERNALQEDINKLVDAIDRIASSSEFNGIKLLDGSFQDMAIHYGARAQQTLTISIDSAKADDLGAFMLNGQGGKVSDASKSYANLLTANTGYAYNSSNDTVKIEGVDLSGAFNDGGAVDAKALADYINSSEELKEKGIEAMAFNKSVADTNFSDISVGTSGLTIKFYIGNKNGSSADITLSYASGTTLTLDKLIADINSAAQNAGVELTASKSGERLVLSTDGSTIGLEVVAGSGTTVDLSTLLEGATGSVSGGTGSAMKVGDLKVLSSNSFGWDVTGIEAGLGVSAVSTSELQKLTDLKVTSNEDAEISIKVVDIAIKKVDNMRAKLGSIQQNLQAIIDNNNFAATQTREAESRIRNVDFAKEMAEFTRYQTLMQSGMAMLAQANQLPQLVLQLLR
ncbi:flagellin [Thermovibrio guaymasensis]|uniref:Flagellin n=1 Tax=Thermovibrio guaymasensis TaxID=240167 RepID=A0A420W9N8_9BACT|nr:flagellin [Thermovibrio guaymasensis]RKQ64029.1 flagellin [Thermovibrio guaymasensis]